MYTVKSNGSVPVGNAPNEETEDVASRTGPRAGLNLHTKSASSATNAEQGHSQYQERAALTIGLTQGMLKLADSNVA